MENILIALLSRSGAKKNFPAKFTIRTITPIHLPFVGSDRRQNNEDLGNEKYAKLKRPTLARSHPVCVACSAGKRLKLSSLASEWTPRFGRGWTRREVGACV